MDLRNLQAIGTAIQARHIAVPLIAAYSVGPEPDAGLVRLHMKQRGFDQAPMVDASGRVVGLFELRQSTQGAEATSRRRPLSEDLLISDATPVAHLFEFMSQEPFLFVVSERRIAGFVTTTDLGSSPVRTHFYLLLAAAEIAMAELVRRDYPDQQVAVKTCLTEERGRAHAKLVADLRKADEMLDDVAAMRFSDLLAVCKENEEVTEWMAANGWSFGTTERGLAHFRDDVMHPVRKFTDGTSKKVAKLARYDRQLKHLVRGVNHALGLKRVREASE